MPVTQADMATVDESFRTGSIGGGMGVMPPSRWAFIFFAVSLAWLILVLSSEG